MSLTPPRDVSDVWWHDQRNQYRVPDNKYDMWTQFWNNRKVPRSLRFFNWRGLRPDGTNLNREMHICIARIFRQFLESRFITRYLYMEPGSEADGPNIEDVPKLDVPVQMSESGFVWTVTRQDHLGAFLFELNTLEDDSICRMMHPEAPALPNAMSLEEIADALCKGTGGLYLHGVELSASMSFMLWPKFGSSDHGNIGMENSLNSDTECSTVFLANTIDFPIWSSKWTNLVCNHYATNSIPFVDGNSRRGPFLDYVDTFYSGSIHWSTKLPEPQDVLEVAEVLDKLKDPVYTKMSMESAQAEHEALVRCYDQSDRLVDTLRHSGQIGHLRAFIVCQIWERDVHGNVTWTKKPVSLNPRCKTPGEISVLNRSPIPVAVLITANDPSVSNGGSETTVALTRQSIQTQSVAIEEMMVWRKSFHPDCSIPQMPVFEREPLSRPTRLDRWVHKGDFGSIELEY